MTLDLHPDCRTSLINVIEEGLSQVTVKNGMFVDRSSLVDGTLRANQVIPDKGKLRNQLTAYVGEFPITDFIGEALAVELQDRGHYLKDAPSIRLIDLQGYKDTPAIAESLVDRMASLPWQYTLSIMMPLKTSSFFNRFFPEPYDIADHIKLVTTKDTLDAQFPLLCNDEKRDDRIHQKSGLAIGPGPEWKTDSAYLQFNVEGLVGMYGATMPAFRVKEMLRSFCGLAIAIKLLRVQYTYNPFPTKTYVYVHRRMEKRWEIDGRFELEEQYAHTYDGIELEDVDCYLKTDVAKSRWAAKCLRDISQTFSAGERAAQILLASQWLFDSYTGNDELLNFIQAMVVLEILLGDKETPNEIGLGELLRNRCAYLVGNSHKQRSDILKDFNAIYRVRSHIVHRGKSRLTTRDRVLFYRLRWMCARVIQEEVKLLGADISGS